MHSPNTLLYKLLEDNDGEIKQKGKTNTYKNKSDAKHSRYAKKQDMKTKTRIKGPQPLPLNTN